MKLLNLINTINSALKAANEFLKEKDHKPITFRELETLTLVSVEGLNGPTKLAELRGVSTAAMTGALDALEKKRLALREHSAQDRRVIPVRLTDLGNEVLKAASDSL